MNEARTSSHPIRVLLADDSALVRRGVASVLQAASGSCIEVVGEVERCADLPEACSRCHPEVVLLDVRFPDGSGLDACRRLSQSHPGVRVIILTSYSSDGFIYEAISAGACGYLMKEIDPDGLVRAVVDASAGRSILDPEATARVMRMVRSSSVSHGGDPLSVLSVQERKVLALVAEGRTNKEIADHLSLSDNTVKNYLGSVFEKLNVKRRSQAAALWVQAKPTQS